MFARLLSLVLLAAVGLPTIAPALALAQNPDAGLPACCRRNGQHHCAMTMERLAQINRQSSSPQIGAVCACYPRHQVAPIAGAHLIAFHAPQHAAAYSTAFAPAARARTSRKIALEPAHPKRGPPSSFTDPI